MISSFRPATEVSHTMTGSTTSVIWVVVLPANSLLTLSALLAVDRVSLDIVVSNQGLILDIAMLSLALVVEGVPNLFTE